MPKVSVILTSYNHADYIGESIESILNQSFCDFELYIVDDCSKDNSWDIICQYKDKRIIKIRHKKNMGGAGLSDLMSKIKGEYFAIAHCDDKWEKEKLEKQVAYMEQYRDVAACFTWVNLIDEDGKLLENQEAEMYTNFNIETKSRYQFLNHFFYYGNCLCHPSILIRKKIQIEENLIATGLGALPDFYRWVKLCLHHNIYIYPEKLTCFRIRKNGKNTSGYNLENLLRHDFDLFPVLRLYEQITNEDEFLQVFPEAKKYKKNNTINVQFSLARLCIEKVKIESYILFGLLLIYDLLQDETNRMEVEKLYSYTPRDFVKETAKYNIFKRIDKKRMMDTSIYLDVGNGYSEQCKQNQKIVLRKDDFEVVFNNIKQEVVAIRFDPDEQQLRKFKDLTIYINGKKVSYKANNIMNRNGWSYFFTMDPICTIDFQGKIDSIVVMGKTKVIQEQEIIELLNKKYHFKKKDFLLKRIIQKLRKRQ